MATYEQHIEGLTQISIESSNTAPTTDELSEFLRDAVIITVNRFSDIRPDEVSKFTTTTDSGSGTTVTRKGKIISVNTAKIGEILSPG